jgi:hypothetical protein
MDEYGPNADTVREDLATHHHILQAKEQGPEALRAVVAEIQAGMQLKIDPLFAAKQGVNYLPVRPEEISQLARTIDETLNMPEVSERLQHRINPPEITE